MKRRAFFGLVALAGGAFPCLSASQSSRVYRIGVILQGGTYHAAVDGLREGLKELGLLEARNYILDVRTAKGDVKFSEMAARALEESKVDLIFTVAASISSATRRATSKVPIVFYTGTDPVALGLVESFRRPGGRLTGIHSQYTALTAKRMEFLKQMLPGLRSVVTFYNPGNPAAQLAINIARDAAIQLKVNLVERHVTSILELKAALGALKPGEVDAIFYVADAVVNSQSHLVIEVARSKKLATMFGDRENVAAGALASYGVSYYELGRIAAKHVHKVLLGANPATLPVEQADKLYFSVNLKTAKALDIKVPASVLARADEVIE